MRRTEIEGRTYEGDHLELERIADTEFFGCSFTGCAAIDCTFEGCSFTECTFTRCNVAQPISSGSQLRYCTFEGCSLMGIDWASWWTQGRLGSAFQGLHGCTLKYGIFASLTMRDLSFEGNKLLTCTFDRCDLKGASFSGCDLDGTEFLECDLRRADLRGASGYRASALRNNVVGARFSYPEALALLEGTGALVE